MGKFLPTLVKPVGKIIFYLVPTRLLGLTRLLYFKKLSHLHRYLELTLIRDLRVHGLSRYELSRPACPRLLT